MVENELNLLIVIINYKTPALVKQCVESLASDLRAGVEVVVVDNHSNDGSLVDLKEWVSQQSYKSYVHLFESKVNSGFSGGNNQGIKYKRATNYLLLNSDTIVCTGAIAKLLVAAEVHPEVGMLSPRLEWEDGTPQISCFRFHRPISELIRAAGTGFVTKLLNKWKVAVPLTLDPSYPEWTSFACVLVKKSTISKVGLMDEGYFLYYEDVDYCYQAMKQKIKILNLPSARVIHLRGGSSDVKKNSKTKKRLPAYVYESRSRYFKKNFGTTQLVLANCLWYLGRTISITREMLGRPAGTVCEKEYRDIWIGIF